MMCFKDLLGLVSHMASLGPFGLNLIVQWVRWAQTTVDTIDGKSPMALIGQTGHL